MLPSGRNQFGAYVLPIQCYDSGLNVLKAKSIYHDWKTYYRNLHLNLHALKMLNIVFCFRSIRNYSLCVCVRELREK